MKTSRIVHIATLATVFGFVTLACAAQERPSEDRGQSKQDNKQQQVRPAQQHAQQHGQQARPSADKRPDVQSQQRESQPLRRAAPSRPAAQQQNRPAARVQNHTAESRGTTRPQQNQGRVAQQSRQVQQAAWQQHSASNWQSDHRNWQQRGGYHGYRIPDARFRGYFGSGHAFLIRGLPFMVVGGFPRFQYNGYWLSVVDPWPQQWGNDWYNNDQVYVDYSDGGYYLYNRSYPGVGIAVSISM
ncbi:MAG: hypothetical protein WB622_02865 [Acidobacteriaceae bacterium]